MSRRTGRRRRKTHRSVRGSQSHYRSPAVKLPKQKTGILGYAFFLGVFLSLAWLVSFAYKNNFFDKKEKPPIAQEKKAQTPLMERIQQTEKRIKLEQDVLKRQAMDEKFKVPVEYIDPLEPKIPPSEMGVQFSENNDMKSIEKELNEPSFKNDVFEDPEEIVRRQLAHQNWLEKYLQKRNEEEKKQFIKDFIEIAKEQGYKVYFKEDMKVILEPIDREKEQAPEEEEVKINWIDE